MTLNFDDESEIGSSLRVDRLYLEQNTDRFVIRVGRQSLSWGNGILFSVLDFFNPFSPAEIDRDYKPGEDMFFSQFKSETYDVQVLALGRRDEQDQVKSDESSFASKLHFSLAEYGTDIDFILAAHYGESYLGFGVSKSLESALIRADGLLVDNRYLNILLNIDRSWTVLERNLYLFAEYFHNGFGQRSGALTPELIQRLERGEVYTIGRDYLTIGGSVEVTPLLSLYSHALTNLGDKSGFFQFRFDLSLFDNTSLLIGANFPIGPNNTEFGGFLLDDRDQTLSIGADTNERFLGPGDSYFVRFSQYF
jgi:hypothetical protein